uniref:Uncharacterized protein n=1 Tax=Setaria italica TaxID=4555 RepID=K3ZYV6_SETIT
MAACMAVCLQVVLLLLILEQRQRLLFSLGHVSNIYTSLDESTFSKNIISHLSDSVLLHTKHID